MRTEMLSKRKVSSTNRPITLMQKPKLHSMATIVETRLVVKVLEHNLAKHLHDSPVCIEKACTPS